MWYGLYSGFTLRQFVNIYFRVHTLMLSMKNLVIVNIKLSSILTIGLFLSTSPVFAESWDFSEKSLGVMIGDEDKTRDPKFEGSKIILKGRYAIKSEITEIPEERKCCTKASHREDFYGLIDAQLWFATDGADLENIRLDFTPFATQLEPEYSSPQKLRTVRDLLELGAIRYITDDALEVESYLELSYLRAGRLGSYNWSENSPFTIKMGMQASTGWAWAESKNPAYSEVSNPFAGIFVFLAIEHDKWGKIYMTQRTVNGFSYSSPARGHPSVREARARFGYFKQLNRHLTLDVLIEKRSFYFVEGGLPSLYTKSGTAAAEFTYLWF